MGRGVERGGLQEVSGLHYMGHSLLSSSHGAWGELGLEAHVGEGKG